MWEWAIGRLIGKKFVFTMITLLLIAVLVATGVLKEETFSSILNWLGTAFLGAEAVQETGKAVGKEMYRHPPKEPLPREPQEPEPRK